MIKINKYDIYEKNGKTMSLYGNTKEEIEKICKKIKIEVQNIEIDKELKYMKYVNQIINNSDGFIYIRNKKYYLYQSELGLIPVYIMEEDNFYMNGCEYIEGIYDKKSKTIRAFQGKYMTPIGWILIKPKEFLEKFKSENSIKFIEYSVRWYGQPKLKKPKELKNIKQWGSVDYIPKHCKCAVYIKNNDVWIKHRDYFSQPMKVKDGDMGTPLSYRCKKYLGKEIKEKFVYPDSWGSIMLRNEAWLKIENLMLFIRRNENVTFILRTILRQMEKVIGVPKNDLEISYMSRMFENLIKQLKTNYIK